MTEYNQDVKIHRGDTRKLFVELNNQDGSDYTPPAGVDIQYRMSRQSQDIDTEALVEKALGTGITLVAGGVDIALVSADTNFPPGIYYHELKIYDGSDIHTTMVGHFHIMPALPMDNPQVISRTSAVVAAGAMTTTPT